MQVSHLYLIFLFVLSASVGILGDNLPKFGKVSDEELQMTSIPEDPEADAVWLFERGDLEIILSGNRYRLKSKRHVRIKILTEKGKEYANFRIPYWHEDDIHSFKAQAILPNGKKIKLNKKDIFEEEDKNWKYKVFAVPGVEVGAVIEYQFEKVSDYLYFLEPWYFQNPEFTRISQYSVLPLPGFSYNVFFRNTVDIEPEIQDVLLPDQRYKLKKYIWTMTNLPPIREEPYMRTVDDYRAALHFQLNYYKDQYQYIKFVSTWPELVEKVRERYKDFLKEDGFSKSLVQGMLLADLPEEEKIKAIYDYVRDQIETTSDEDFYVDSKPGLVAKESKGSGAEKNLLLVNLLNSAGFKAYPLLISSRDNGLVRTNTPQLTQFNHVLAFVRSGLNNYVMDTRDKYCPFKMLPVNDLVEIGLLIDEGEGKFVNIPHPRTINMVYCKTTSEISPEGDLIAATVARFDGYRALGARKRIAKNSEKEFIYDRLKDRYGEVEIDSFEIGGLENLEHPLTIMVNYRVPNYAQVTGDMIYLNAPILNGLEENPFKREKRYFPVEFPYNLAETEDIEITCPEGFNIVEIPQAVINRQQQGKLTFMNNWTAEDKRLKIQRQFMLQKLTFSPRKYKGLRNFYDSVVKADQGQIVLGQTQAQGKVTH